MCSFATRRGPPHNHMQTKSHLQIPRRQSYLRADQLLARNHLLQHPGVRNQLRLESHPKERLQLCAGHQRQGHLGSLQRRGVQDAFAEGDSIEYASTVCLKMQLTDALVKEYYFATTRVVLRYADREGREKELDVTSISQKSCGFPCKPATAYVIIKVPVVGKLKFNQVVVFRKDGEGFGGDDGLDPNYIEVRDDIELEGMEKSYGSISTVERSSAIRSVTTLVTIFILAILAL
eukprot:TRINITY_DN12512_c0_g1_i10.p1 TRINITY_DN12512_c0_g1~~TRINITY_DN12512_c0_g1_i10.p1  ORF type:complete len:234 (-),score=7.86 TRINITY_DN12512_c0_g1_i10:147-848(-)